MAIAGGFWGLSLSRFFHTLQDRLVKEIWLKGMSTIAQANRFLSSYLSVYNRRFNITPKKEGDLHRTIDIDIDIDLIDGSMRSVTKGSP